MIGLPVSILLPSAVLGVAAIDDIRSRKVHNWLVLLSAAITLVTVVALDGWSRLPHSLGYGAFAFALGLPLVLARALGAGDLKIFTVFGFATDWNAVFFTLVYSLIWGALLGVFRAVLQGQFVPLMQQTFFLAVGQKKLATDSPHKIPYTIALFFGWLTHLSLMGVFS